MLYLGLLTTKHNVFSPYIHDDFGHILRVSFLWVLGGNVHIHQSLSSSMGNLCKNHENRKLATIYFISQNPVHLFIHLSFEICQIFHSGLKCIQIYFLWELPFIVFFFFFFFFKCWILVWILLCFLIGWYLWLYWEMNNSIPKLLKNFYSSCFLLSTSEFHSLGRMQYLLIITKS